MHDAWLALAHALELGYRRSWRKALAELGSIEALASASPATLDVFGLSGEPVERFKFPDSDRIAAWRRWLAGGVRSLVTLGAAGYPPLLAETADPPLVLWLEGAAVELLSAPQLAIVGSRSPTGTGLQTAEQFAAYLGARGLTITSGLANGIDGASHRGALGTVGGTLAVLGSGLDIVFPRMHTALAREIAATGLLVSEYVPGTPAQRYHFPERNRIIAGLSVGTLVVEAARRSGSLITARLASDYGREVFAIPGSIHNPLARGCHRLIRDGAKLVEEAGDVLVELAALLSLTPEEVAPAKHVSDTSDRFEDPAYSKVLAALDFAPTPFATTLERVGLTAAELSSMLLVLELEGFVEALPGGRYARLAKRDP